MEKKTGFEQLLEALKGSGMDMSGSPFGQGSPFGGNAQGNAQNDAQGSAQNATSADAATAGASDNQATQSATAGEKQTHNPFSHGKKDTQKAHIEIPFAERLAQFGKRALITLGIILVVVILAAYWWFHPPINIHSEDTWFFIAIFILLPLFLFFIGKSGTYKKGTEKIEKSPAKAKTFKILALVPVGVFCVALIGTLLSFSFIPGNAHKYATVLTTENLDFAEDIQEVDYTQIPVIDRATAIVLGNKEMGTIADYVSQFEVEELYSQINYQNTPVRVSPLGYADLFKWLTNRGEGIPAYCVVDMTTQDAEIVRISSVDGTQGQGMKYTQSEPLARNIDRYVQLKYPFYMFDELSFEIDESGHPWWICPVQTRTIGLFGGTTISRVVLVDAVTGECQNMKVEDCPSWVDRVYPADLLIQQYNWYGAYNNGWLNSWLGQSGVVQTTPGEDGDLGYNYIAKDDDVWVYTGVTSATSDSSIIGFVLINQRTQESHFYSVAGATEESAMASAEGQVQNLRYTSTFPILINVGSQPTYFMALKDAAGLVKKFAMIDIQRYQNVAVGDTVADTQSAYVNLLATNGIQLESSTGALEAKEASGKIDRMAHAVVDGNSHYYVKLDGDSTVYDFPLPNLLAIVGYEEGDTISFTYTESGGAYTAQAITDDAAPTVSAARTSSSSSSSSGDATADTSSQ